MSLSETLENMKEIQTNLLEFLEDEEEIDENFHRLEIVFDNQKIQNNKYGLISLFHLITRIANNYHRTSTLYSKIDRILRYFINSIKIHFSNTEIFNIFKSNKRILLFLIEEKIIMIDEYFIKTITSGKYLKANYPRYFMPEIKQFKILKSQQNETLPENFYTNRKIGENENYICKLIREDAIEEFITYVNKTNFSLKSEIIMSIYETNSYLIKNTISSIFNIKDISLIQYVVFFGSIQIFQYLIFNKVELDSSLWMYAIHGKNPDIIHILEEHKIQPLKKDYENCLIESIKCHHNDIADYFKNNYLLNNVDNDTLNIRGIKYHNFYFIDADLINQSNLHYLCQYDQPSFVYSLLINDNINETIVYKYFFFNEKQIQNQNFQMELFYTILIKKCFSLPFVKVIQKSLNFY